MAASVREGAAAAAAAGHAADDYDVSDGEMDVDVEAGSELQHAGDDRRDGDGDGDGDDEYALLSRITDTSAAEARAGKDIQGIPWERLQITRQDYRKARLEQYKNYENFPQSGELMDKLCKQVESSSKYYEFQYNTRIVKPSILHFQLRNLLWATSKHDVYFMSNSTVGHWSSLSHKMTDVLDFSGHVAPAKKHPGCALEGFTGVQVSTLAVNEGLLVAGGFQGELVCKSLGERDVKFCTRTTLSDNAITNAMDIHRSTSGSLRITVSNNDSGVREFDMDRFQLLNHFRFNWPVNHTSVSPDKKLLAVVGDDRDALLVDSRNGKVTSTLVGHLDYSFASAWHPDGVTFATGNQDKTCRVWDIRNPSTSLAVLRGNIGAIRCIRYSSDGRFLLFSEPADFVHVYSAAECYRKRQEIDFFGEISGISLSPDDESLFVGVCDRVYASLLNYRMVHANGYLDSYM
ncbi:uncharacterized WD repeat-containing protein C2A9.03-like [Triticum dicoccoides]|uniref:uncharacterized WD repeat-containing protein C2A9.03-like n=1 Tax=Triticum dicoccoides TaxID=85692 RepID=UPI001891C071|nr:uncharacterized WD repeat-containing protein C2A9.03-like [Triticum dicoccoides]